MSVRLRPSPEMDVISGLEAQHASLKNVFPKTAESKRAVKRIRRKIREEKKKIQSNQSTPIPRKRKAEDGNMRVAVLKKVSLIIPTTNISSLPIIITTIILFLLQQFSETLLSPLDLDNPMKKTPQDDSNLQVSLIILNFPTTNISSLPIIITTIILFLLQQSSKKPPPVSVSEHHLSPLDDTMKKTPQDNPSGRRPLNSNHLYSKSLSALCRNCETNSLRLTFLEEWNSRMEEWKSMMEEKMRKMEMRLSKRRT